MTARRPDRFSPDPTLEFLDRIWRLNRAMERLSYRMEKALGITAPQRLLLRCLGRRPSMTPSEIAAVLHLDRGTVTAGVARLVERGLVSRRPGEEDRRSVTLALTSAGRALDRPSKDTVEHAVHRMLEASVPEDVEAAKRVLEELIGFLDREAAGGAAPPRPPRTRRRG